MTEDQARYVDPVESRSILGEHDGTLPDDLMDLLENDSD